MNFKGISDPKELDLIDEIAIIETFRKETESQQIINRISKIAGGSRLIRLKKSTSWSARSQSVSEHLTRIPHYPEPHLNA